MHAVAEVYLGGRWRLIDPTGRAPVEGLVRVATVLDAADIAFITLFGRAELWMPRVLYARIPQWRRRPIS